MSGYVKLAKSAFELVGDKDLWQLYGYLLSKADGNGVVDTSLSTIQRDLKVTQKPLRTMLTKLERANKVAKQGASKGSKIILCDIADYARQGVSKGSKRGANKRASENESETTLPTAISTPSFVAPEYVEIWQKFIAYRKEIKKPYKSESSEKIAYNKMVEMANDDPAAAKDMVERTILGQWQGLFPKDNNGIKSIPTADNAISRKAQRDRGLSYATEIVARSENLFNLYNGGGSDPDTRKD